MEKLPDYIQTIEDNQTLLVNHNNLLKSLLLSKQAHDNNVYTSQTTNESTDVSLDSGEGISESSNTSLT